jgi:hypothetical protein
VALSVAVRRGPAGTAANGTVVARRTRTTFVEPGKSPHQLDRRVRPDPGGHPPRWQGPSPARGSREVGFEAASTLAGDRAQEREGAATCDTGGWRESQDERTASICPCSRSQRRRCRATASDFLAAGFDSYLSKQVNVVKLIQQCGNSARRCVGKAGCLLDLLSRAFPLAADGRP